MEWSTGRGQRPSRLDTRLEYSVRKVQLTLRQPFSRELAGQESSCLTEEANQGQLVGDKIAQQDL